MGPHSRALLQPLSDERSRRTRPFPSGTSREIEIGHARLRATRISYMGELGWELYVPSEFAVGLFDRIVAAGGDHRPAASAACMPWIACRIEKAYRHWGHDISDEDTPLEAGLGFRGQPSTRTLDFIGREALLRAARAED